MNPLQPNPQTGFLESINPTSTETFSSDKKVRFLELATQFAKKHEYPDVASLCDAVGIRHRTLTYHIENDELFREAWNEVKQRLASAFTNELSVKAKSKNGIIANLAVLKYLESGTWLNEQKLIINSDLASVKAANDRSSGAIEAEIVERKRLSDGNGGV